MPLRREIWYFEGSPAESVAKLLARHYVVRALPRGPAELASRPAKEKPSKTQENSPGDRGPSQTNNSAPAVCLADLAHDDPGALRHLARKHPQVPLIGLISEEQRGRHANGATGLKCFTCLPRSTPRAQVEQTLAAAFEHLELAERERSAREELERAERETEELNRIGVALSSTHDVNALLELILRKARSITGADAGSLYLVEESPNGERRLRFRLTQNDSRQFPFTELTLPISEKSMAGYVALHGQVLQVDDAYGLLPGKSKTSPPFQFNPKYDQESGYRTRSILTLPMKDAKGEVLGVLQLINCKRNPAARLEKPEDFEREVQAFPARAERLALSLASQAAVAYENSKLYQDIETLFEGFVHAAVTAIEQRDPTTSGHSQRVSTMTVGLAETLDRTDHGAYADVRFTREQMKEIRYAALLHDFGKVGVREEVLVKAKKLYPAQLSVVQTRFDYVRKELESQFAQRKIKSLLGFDRKTALGELARLDEEYRERLEEIDDYFQFILHANEPTVLPTGQFDKLIEIARRSYHDPQGIEHPLLTPEEVRFLSIPQGSLDPDERQQIELHVVHSFNFLMQIPWTREIKDIPLIARAHHEKLNGTGYPYKLRRDEIPLQAKIMTVCDMFDALSASDRPYKKAVAPERALEILEMSVRENELDPVLFRLFVDAKIYQLTHKRS